MSDRHLIALSRKAGFKVFPTAGYVGSAVVCAAQAAALRRPESLLSELLAAFLLFMLVLALARTPDLKQYLQGVSVTLFGVLYVAFTLSWLVPLRFGTHSPAWAAGRELMLLLFFVIWAGDICAFFGGMAFGRTPLSPRISPKKTVEGAVTGFAGSLLAAWGLQRWFWQTADLKNVILIAGGVALAGQLGDLVESAMKRGAEVKDSGTLLPGHGGLLDRIDSLLFGAPTLWIMLVVMNLSR